MNELNFARFEAKIEARIGTLEAKIDQGIAGLESRLDARIDLVEARLNGRLEAAMREQTRFFFLAWAVLLASNIALWFR